MALLRPRVLATCIMMAAFALLPAAGTAQQAAPTQRPYKPVAVTLPGLVTDKSLDAFRKQLAAIVQRKDRAALAKLVVAKDFFWEGDLGGVFDPKKSGFDNLTAALRLPDADGRGWAALGTFAAETTVGPGATNAEARCVPAQPDYEDAELAELTEATDTDVVDWSYPRAAGLQVRATAVATAPVIETLGLYLVRVLGYENKDRAATERPWVRIATPGGKVGYVPPGSLVSPLSDRLCFGKEANAWRIVGYTGTGD